MNSRKNKKKSKEVRTARASERKNRRHPGETEYNEEAAAADQRAGVNEQSGVDDPTDPYLNPEASRASIARAVDRSVYDDGTTETDEVVDFEADEITDNDLGFTLIDTSRNQVLGNPLDPELSPDSITLGADAGQVIESMDEWTEDQEILDDFAERQRMSTDTDNLLERFQENTHVSPNLTGNDIDADWERAQQVGEEAVGGSVPTPGQNIVEDLGEAAGLTYRDDEPLHSGDILEQRDAQRWELDPRSAVDNTEDLEDEDLTSFEDLDEDDGIDDDDDIEDVDTDSDDGDSDIDDDDIDDDELTDLTFLN